MVSKIVGKKIVDLLADITSILGDTIREIGYDKLGIQTEANGTTNDKTANMGASNNQGLPQGPTTMQSTKGTEQASKTQGESSSSTESSAI